MSNKNNPGGRRELDLSNLKEALSQLAKANSLNEQLYEALANEEQIHKYVSACLNFPIGNAIIGAIVAGWDLRDKVLKLDESSKIVLQ